MTFKSLTFCAMCSVLVACYGDLPVTLEAEAEAPAEEASGADSKPQAKRHFLSLSSIPC